MIRSLHSLCVPLVFVLFVGLTCDAAVAADRTKVDQATRHVEHGAKQIGRGGIAPGFKEMFTGIGHTIVEGAKFSGNTIGEAFKKSSASSPASGAHR
jgi:hypothetical protein